MEDPIPIEELIASGAKVKDGDSKAIAIINSSLAIISVVASSTLIWMIQKSPARLTTTYHRILLGMSIGDIIFSLCLSPFNSMAPKDDNYFVWNARGDMSTCSAQGFLLFLGAGSGLFYTCSLNLYYLAVVKYQKPDPYIRTKIEPFLHGVPIALILIISITLLAKENINHGGGGNCYAPIYDPQHCIGYEDGVIREGFEIPCGRGRDGAVTFYYLVAFVTFFVVPLIIGVSLGMIYRAVLQQEKKIARYGAGAFTASVQPSNTSDADQRAGAGSLVGRISSIASSVVSFLKNGRTTGEPSSSPASNQGRSNSRSVLHRATAYTLSLFLCWSFFIIGLCFDIAGVEWPTSIWYLTSIFNPLQGVFNFLIFMHPKVVTAKSKGNNITWCQAFAKVFRRREGNAGPRRGGGQPNQRVNHSSPRDEGDGNENQIPRIIPCLHNVPPTSSINVDGTDTLDRLHNNLTTSNSGLESGFKSDVNLGEQQRQRRLQMQQNVQKSEHYFKTLLQNIDQVSDMDN